MQHRKRSLSSHSRLTSSNQLLQISFSRPAFSGRGYSLPLGYGGVLFLKGSFGNGMILDARWDVKPRAAYGNGAITLVFRLGLP